jgi:hypothetical protein
MRKPLITKKTSTPTKPPEGQSKRWSTMTATTARARRPSTSGRNPRFTVAGESPSGGGFLSSGAERSSDGSGSTGVPRRNVCELIAQVPYLLVYRRAALL